MSRLCWTPGGRESDRGFSTYRRQRPEGLGGQNSPFPGGIPVAGKNIFLGPATGFCRPRRAKWKGASAHRKALAPFAGSPSGRFGRSRTYFFAAFLAGAFLAAAFLAGAFLAAAFLAGAFLAAAFLAGAFLAAAFFTGALAAVAAFAAGFL